MSILFILIASCAIIVLCFTIVHIIVKEEIPFLSKKVSISSFIIYPYPAVHYAYIALDLANEPVALTTSIMDPSGKEVFLKEQVGVMGKLIQSLPVEQFSDGIYEVMVKAGNSELRKKLVILK